MPADYWLGYWVELNISKPGPPVPARALLSVHAIRCSGGWVLLFPIVLSLIRFRIGARSRSAATWDFLCRLEAYANLLQQQVANKFSWRGKNVVEGLCLCVSLAIAILPFPTWKRKKTFLIEFEKKKKSYLCKMVFNYTCSLKLYSKARNTDSRADSTLHWNTDSRADSILHKYRASLNFNCVMKIV